MTKENIVYLDPAKILAEDNARFGLLGFRVDSMAESIVERGGVQEPVEVQKLTPPVNGFQHRLTSGFYRHAGTLKLNTESGAGLLLPAIVREPSDDLDRTKRQLSENLDRENLSPMDKAIAIRRLLDKGVSKGDVRKLFKVPGGRKGLTMQPASNSFINMHLAFLDLSKSIQAKIHDGRVGTAAAHELTRVPKEQQEEILDKAEKKRLAAIDRDEREDERESKQEETAAEKQAKVDAIRVAHEQAEAALAEAKAKVAAAKEAEAEARKTPTNYLDLPDVDKKAIAEKVGAAKLDTKAAIKAEKAAINVADKARVAFRKLTEPAGEPLPGDDKPAVKAKGKAAPVKKATVGPKDVKAAAKEAGVSKKVSPLTLTEAREAMVAISKSRMPKAKAIGAMLVKMLAGELAVGSVVTDIEVVTGERKTGKA